jgi:hypothetical protein
MKKSTVVYPKEKLFDKLQQEFLRAERLELARQIAEYDPPPIMLPAALKPVDRKLLAITAARLRRSKSVLVGEKCSKTVQ